MDTFERTCWIIIAIVAIIVALGQGVLRDERNEAAAERRAQYEAFLNGGAR